MKFKSHNQLQRFRRLFIALLWTPLLLLAPFTSLNLASSASALEEAHAQSSLQGTATRSALEDKTSESSSDANTTSENSLDCAPTKTLLQSVLLIKQRQLHLWEDSKVVATANILCIHGLGLSAIDFDKFATYAATHGLRTFAISIHGFGAENERVQGDSVDYEAAMNEIHEALLQIHKIHPGEPVFLLGESLGGSVAIDAASRYPEQISGLICSTPTWRFNGEKTVNIKAFFCLILGRWSRRLFISEPIVRRATSDPALQNHWLHHPDHRIDLSIKEALETYKYISRTPVRARRIKELPVLFVQGLNDRLTKLNSIAHLFAVMPTQNKKLVLDCNQEHVIFEEGCFSQESFNALMAWVNSEVQKLRMTENHFADGRLLVKGPVDEKEKRVIDKLFKTAGLNLKFSDFSNN